MARNLSQPQIDRRKKAGAHVGQVTSGLSLGALGVLGVGAAAKGKSGGKFLTKIPGLKKTNPEKFGDTATKIGIVSGGIAGLNGFNNASWQSAEARQRKKAIVKKNDYVSPFEEGYFGEEGRKQDFSKALAPAATTAKKPGLNGGMKALRPMPKFKPLGQRPVSPNVKAMRPVQLGGAGGGVGSPAGLSGVGKAFGGGSVFGRTTKVRMGNAILKPKATHMTTYDVNKPGKRLGLETVKRTEGGGLTTGAKTVLGGGAAIAGGAALSNKKKNQFGKSSAFGVDHD